MPVVQITGKAYDARLIRRLWVFLAPHWRLLLMAMILIPISVGFEIVQPYLLKIAIDDHIAPGSLDGLGIIALLYIVFVLLQSLSGFAQQFALQLLGQRSMHDLRRVIYSHVVRQRMAFFDHTPVGQLLTRMTNDVESINEMFASGVVTVVADFIKLVAIVSMMFALNAKLTLVCFAVLPALIMLVEYARRLMRASFREVRTRLAAMNAYVQEHLSGLRIIQLFRREAKTIDNYNTINAGFRDAYLKAIRADASMYAGVEAIGTVSVACVVWYAAGEMAEGILTVGLVFAFIDYINKFFIPVRDLSAKYTIMQSAMAATERIVALLDTHEPDAAAAMKNVDPSYEPGESCVEFHNVNFAYHENEPVLFDVSLDVAYGQTVAVVGTTGSGKSTLMKLLTRLYEHQSGDIFVNGSNVKTIPPRELRRQITVVSQDVFLFPGSVADNVRMAAPEADDQAVRDALSKWAPSIYLPSATQVQILWFKSAASIFLPANASSSPLPAPWRANPRSSYLMRQPPTSIPRPKPTSKPHSKPSCKGEPP